MLPRGMYVGLDRARGAGARMHESKVTEAFVTSWMYRLGDAELSGRGCVIHRGVYC